MPGWWSIRQLTMTRGARLSWRSPQVEPVPSDLARGCFQRPDPGQGSEGGLGAGPAGVGPGNHQLAALIGPTRAGRAGSASPRRRAGAVGPCRRAAAVPDSDMCSQAAQLGSQDLLGDRLAAEVRSQSGCRTSRWTGSSSCFTSSGTRGSTSATCCSPTAPSASTADDAPGYAAAYGVFISAAAASAFGDPVQGMVRLGGDSGGLFDLTAAAASP